MDSTAHEDLLERARAWLAQDPDPDTRAELRALLEGAEVGDADALDALHDRFATRLAFGTKRMGALFQVSVGATRMGTTRDADRSSPSTSMTWIRTSSKAPATAVVKSRGGA